MNERRKAGRKMTYRTFAQYRSTVQWFVDILGKAQLLAELKPTHFTKLMNDLGRHGPVKRGKEVQHIKTMFNWALENEKIERLPNFGSEFKKPGKTELRLNRAKRGKRLFTAAEIRELLDGRTVEKDGKPVTIAGATRVVRAMILLGINCGFGNMDVSSLPKPAINFDKAMIEFPRPKNGMERRCPLWPETVKALKLAISERPEAKDKADADCAFITRQGSRWVRDKITAIKNEEGNDDDSQTKIATINSVSLEFGKVLRRLHINGRKGLGFYSLRHTFRTIADAAKDTPAVRLIMGHADGSLDDVYREQIDDDRLDAVVGHVRTWLFGEGGAK